MVKINSKLFGHEYFGNEEAIYKMVELNDTENTIKMMFEDNRDITNMQMAALYIRDKHPNCRLVLDLPYIPYSAMDREINEQIFSFKHFAELVNTIQFDKVIVFDPHNQAVVDEYMHNVEYRDINEYTSKVIKDFNPDVIFFPDKGANTKYPALIDTFGLPVIHGNKKRELANRGRLSTLEIVSDIDLKDKRILIIDDICRKGGTFLMASNELKKHGVAEIGLYVSHCETGIFEGAILNEDSNISKVYTTNSEPAFIGLMELKDNLNKSDKIKII